MSSQVYPIRCRIRGEGGVTRVDIYDDIGTGDWFSDGISAKDFSAKLASIKGPLDVHINSYGGDVDAGIAIGNNIQDYKGPKRTFVDGFACSIASVIMQAGDERIVQPGSMMMVHDALSLCVGNAADMQKTAANLDKHSDNIAGIYASRAGGSVQQWRDIMQAETWFTADEAVAAGLADKVGDREAVLPADFDLAAFAMVPGRIAARLRSMPQAAAAPHGPMTGTHTHPHPAYGSQGSDASHEHEHGHDGDASHQHSHGGDAEDRGARVRNAPGKPYEPEPYHRDPDETVQCPKCQKFNDLDASYCDQCGLRLAGRDDVEETSGPGGDGVSDRLTGDQIRALVRDEIHLSNAAVDESSWDGPAAMSWASSQDDPESAFRAICAAEKTTGEPDTQAHWALPHHRHAGDPPNRNGVNNCMSRLSQTQDLKSASAAQAHLEAHQKAMGGGDSAGDHAHLDLSGVDLEQLGTALRGALG